MSHRRYLQSITNSISMPSGRALLTMKIIVGDDLRDDNSNVLCGVLRNEVFDGLLNVDLAICSGDSFLMLIGQILCDNPCFLYTPGELVFLPKMITIDTSEETQEWEPRSNPQIYKNHRHLNKKKKNRAWTVSHFTN